MAAINMSTSLCKEKKSDNSCYMLAAISGFFMTRITNFIKNNMYEEIQQDLIKLTRFLFIFTGLILFVFIVLGKEFIHLWLGDGFSDVYFGTTLVMIATYIYSPHAYYSNNILLIQNQVKYQGFTYIIMGLTNVVLTVILSSIIGVVGAALSIFISYTLRNILMMIIYYKNIKISWKSFYMRTYVKIIVPFFIGLILAHLFKNIYPINGPFSFLLNTLFGSSIFISLIIIFYLTKEEKNKIINYIKKVMKGKEKNVKRKVEEK